jgi:cullin 1
MPSPLTNCIEGKIFTFCNFQINKIILGFKTYYSGKYNGRKLNWVLQMSRGELVSTPKTFAQKYTFTVGCFFTFYNLIPTNFQCYTQQIAMLMLFNEKEVYKFEDSLTQLGMARDQLAPVVNSLVKVGLLKMVGGGQQAGGSAAELANDCELELNLEFTK